jgi:hypothetical protein
MRRAMRKDHHISRLERDADAVRDVEEATAVCHNVKRRPAEGLGDVLRLPFGSKQANDLQFGAPPQQWRQFSEDVHLAVHIRLLSWS